MAQQETYGNWLGPKRLVRQPGIYSVAGKMSPVGDFRPASPDSFEDDYDDVSMAGSERGPGAKGVYLLAGPPGSSRAASLKDAEDPERNSRDWAQNSGDLAQNSRDWAQNSRDWAQNSRDLAQNSRNSRNSVALAALAALSALAWGGLAAAAVAKHKELRAELELLKSNLSGIWDSVQQEQTRLQFGIHQHQQELQEVNELLCHTSSSRRCPAGWKSHGSSCYSFSRDSLSWGSARDACGDLGAHLVVVNSEEEQVFLVENIERNGSYWLGVTDEEHEGKWLWVNGDDPNYRFWDVWAPDADRELKDCGTIGASGRWLNERCGESRRWICEKPGNC